MKYIYITLIAITMAMADNDKILSNLFESTGSKPPKPQYASGNECAKEIGHNMPRGLEPSGIAWHSRLEQLVVVGDDGEVFLCDINGDNSKFWNLEDLRILGMDEEPDFEAVTVADPNTNFVYIANEEPAAIVEFDILTGKVHRVFDVDSIVHQHNYEAKTARKYKNKGIEALAFVPSNITKEGGYFYVGLQDTGYMLILELPIKSSTTATHSTYKATVFAGIGIPDISGLEYYPEDGYLYATFDDQDLMVSLTLDGQVVHKWKLPNDGQEGSVIVNLQGNKQFVVVAEDGGKKRASLSGLRRYSFPVPADCSNYLVSMDYFIG